MKSKKIIVAILALVMIATIAAAFTGCTTKLTKEEGFAAMSGAINNSIKQQTYFVKENIYNHENESGKGTLEKKLNIHEDNIKTTLNDTVATYTEVFTKALALETTYYYQWSFGQSLSKNIKPKKAQDSDYKPYMFIVKDKAMSKKLSSMEEFLTLPNVNEYTISKVLEELVALTMADLVDFKATKAGVITSYTFVVNKEGHAYNGKPMKIQSMYDKISLIEATTKGATAEFKIDITYKGPKIDTPNFDGKYNEKEIVDIV